MNILVIWMITIIKLIIEILAVQNKIRNYNYYQKILIKKFQFNSLNN